MTDHIRPVTGLTALCVAAMLAVSSMPATAQGDRATRGDRIVLHQDVPDRYVVVRGDTLWDISARFLRDPWLWPEVWEVNPQIENPHLIYPGDIIYLVWVDGEPRLRLVRETEDERLSPRIRVLALDDAIPLIPLDVIRPFLLRSHVISRDELDHAPYILRSVDGHLMSGEGHRIYVRGIPQQPDSRWTVVREGAPFRDPANNDILGYEATYIGEVRLERAGDPATAMMTSSQREALLGDRLIPLAAQTLDRGIHPRAPRDQIEGMIIRRMAGGDYIGQYDVVALSRGHDAGLEPGHVLAIWRAGAMERDMTPSRMRRSRLVQLPDERIGEALVFRVAPRVSYALVMRSTEDIASGDYVRNP